MVLGEVLDVGDTRAIWASFATMILLAALAGWWWGRWSVVSGPFPLAGALALSVTAAMSLGSLGSFGVMNSREEFEVGDDSVGMPHALLIMGTFAMAYVVKAARQPVR
ncbi:hypothetical protein [Catelliglobosispora koreensis]|uniref:hypothetical protein n=1 Tax=Catelliglobosispora koreensis TaxID=129052 RepID=UPI000365AABE|nr:hypothetical protein [Catelliglobosispora koreensis]